MVMSKILKFILILLITSILYYMLEEGGMDPNGKLFKYMKFVLPPDVRPVGKFCQY